MTKKKRKMPKKVWEKPQKHVFAVSETTVRAKACGSGSTDGKMP